MTTYERIPGVEMLFTASEIATLKEHFCCKTNEELVQAAQCYQDLFLLFGYVEKLPGDIPSVWNHFQPRPDEPDCHMRLALALAEVVFENLKADGFKLRHPETPRVGRKSRPRIPEEVAAILRNPGSRSQIEAAEELLSGRKLKTGISAKTLVKYFAEDEREREERLRQLHEDFENVSVPSVNTELNHD